MSISEFPDGIKVGPVAPGSFRQTMFDFDEYVADAIDLGTMQAGEVKTIVFNGVANVRAGATILARPSNPANFGFLTIKHAYCSNLNQISVIIKNDSNVEQTPILSDEWVLSFWCTANLPPLNP